MSSSDPANSRTLFRLPSTLDLRAAKPLKESLSPYLSHGRPITIDAGDVTRMSTACAQVLVSFAVTAKKHSMPVSFSPASPVFTQALALLGLSAFIEETRQ
jgi:anti-anti-sigma regulatory factor